MVGMIISRQAGIIMDERVTVIIGRRITGGDWIWIVVYRLLVVRRVHREAISWGVDREIIKDNGWRRD